MRPAKRAWRRRRWVLGAWEVAWSCRAAARAVAGGLLLSLATDCACERFGKLKGTLGSPTGAWLGCHVLVTPWSHLAAPAECYVSACILQSLALGMAVVLTA